MHPMVFLGVRWGQERKIVPHLALGFIFLHRTKTPNMEELGHELREDMEIFRRILNVIHILSLLYYSQ